MFETNTTSQYRSKRNASNKLTDTLSLDEIHASDSPLCFVDYT